MLDVVMDDMGVTVKAKLPVMEMIGWASDLRSATAGKGISSLVDQTFERLPSELQPKIIVQVRGRKGLAENQ
jgi:elongation factor 2